VTAGAVDIAPLLSPTAKQLAIGREARVAPPLRSPDPAPPPGSRACGIDRYAQHHGPPLVDRSPIVLNAQDRAHDIHSTRRDP
jgi:hypothetical protein